MPFEPLAAVVVECPASLPSDALSTSSRVALPGGVARRMGLGGLAPLLFLDDEADDEGGDHVIGVVGRPAVCGPAFEQRLLHVDAVRVGDPGVIGDVCPVAVEVLRAQQAGVGGA